MERLLPKPWLVETLRKLLAGDGSDFNFTIHNKPKIVQLLSCHEDTLSIVISDKEAKVHVFLTEDCFSSFNFLSQIHIMDLFEMKKYHFTTVTQVGYGKFGRDLQALENSFPFALHCCDMEWKYSCDVLNGNFLCDLNSEESIKDLISKYNYLQMYALLSKRQFPDVLQLPEHGDFY
jgi:hypothetical protein